MLNTTTTFEGNIATVPELAYTTHKGIAVTEFVVLVNRRTQDAEGEWLDAEPTRHRVKIYGRMAEHAAQLERGTTVIVHGQVHTERWADRDTGEARTSDHVVAEAIGASLRWATVQVTKQRHSDGPTA